MGDWEDDQPVELRQRKQIRLQDRDYSRDGYYFITMCVKDHWPILCDGSECDPETSKLPLSEIGEIVRQSIDDIPKHYPGIRVDQYIIMPNHIHMILVINEEHGHTAHTASISRIIQMMKGIVTKTLGYSIWQKSFHDHIIRTETDYLRIWEYIDANPAKWQDDCYYSEQPAAL